MPIADVEQAVREACKRWTVREVAADPFRWQRSLQALDAEGIPVIEYPQSPARMNPATSRFYTAVTNGGLTHSGDVGEATLGNWVNKYRREHAGEEPPLDVTDRVRLREVERQLREVKMENEFLKKAAAYFAQDQR